MPATSSPIIIRDEPGWPVVFELPLGVEYRVRRAGREWSVRLDAVRETRVPDRWQGAQREILVRADVDVTVNGRAARLVCRPYQMPETVEGLRLYVESTHAWSGAGEIASLEWFGGDARFSAAAEGEPWGPAALRFPVQNYRWRANSYNNTWGALVPYNLHYYHRGDDFGAIPNRLPVVSAWGGEVVQSPLPGGDGGSNSLAVAGPGGVIFRYAHMNAPHIARECVIGNKVEPGSPLGRTGCTWDGWESQYSDPHLHVEIESSATALPWATALPGTTLLQGTTSLPGRTNISSYPFLVEAYLRDYPDPLLPVAGGYHYGLTGATIGLDGSRSLARPGEKIAGLVWKLHDGREVAGPLAEVTYPRPGLYSEKLIARTESGREDWDYAQVRIYDPARAEIAFGWFYASPARGAHPGAPVTFWNRLNNTQAEVLIDYGDGTPPEPVARCTQHAYAAAGMYEASLRARGPANEPVTVRIRVVVDGAASDQSVLDHPPEDAPCES